jgi:hypothetical protein
MTKEFIGSQTDVFDNLAREDWRDVSATVDGYCCTSSIGMAKLLVGAPLPYLFEPEAAENRDHLSGGENRQSSHGLGRDGLNSDELGLKLGLAILKEHGDDLMKIAVEFVT